MTTSFGPKLMFMMPPRKIPSFEDLIQGDYDLDQKICSTPKVERKVSFAASTIVFLRYSEEEIIQFRQRLKSQLQCSIELIESSYLNPQLCSPSKQSRRKSCFKEYEEQFY